MDKQRAGGRVVKEWKGFFLRDDTEIRSGGSFEGREEAYSLFREKPYERIEVFAGSEKWAIERAAKVVVIETILKTAAEEAFGDDPDWEIPHGNYDDTFYLGCDDGEIMFARRLRKILKG